MSPLCSGVPFWCHGNLSKTIGVKKMVILILGLLKHPFIFLSHNVGIFSFLFAVQLLPAIFMKIKKLTFFLSYIATKLYRTLELFVRSCMLCYENGVTLCWWNIDTLSASIQQQCFFFSYQIAISQLPVFFFSHQISTSHSQNRVWNFG